ncbi:MAG: hypothetical protein J6E40_08695 [Lachnospiraceae bacterium]|nr:hypothetical protein [Lachnospiraceae bacterium]
MNSIYTRVSIRKYQDRPVEKEKTEAILRAAMQAVEKILSIPDNLRAFAIFPYGYPAEERKQQDRFEKIRIHYVE